MSTQGVDKMQSIFLRPPRIAVSASHIDVDSAQLAGDAAVCVYICRTAERTINPVTGQVFVYLFSVKHHCSCASRIIRPTRWRLHWLGPPLFLLPRAIPIGQSSAVTARGIYWLVSLTAKSARYASASCCQSICSIAQPIRSLPNDPSREG